MTKVARGFAVAVALFVSLTMLVPVWASGKASLPAAETALASTFDEQNVAPATDTSVKALSIAFDETHTITMNWGWDLFAKDSSVYDHNLAMGSVLLAQATKISQATTEARLTDLGFGHLESAFYGNIFAVDNPATTLGSRVVEFDGQPKVVIALIVRGTDNFGDILTDIGAFFNRFSLAAANVGERFDAYYAGLSDYYGFDVNADNAILYLAGHSLGGSVAGQLAVAADGVYAQREAIFAYTFGSPRYAIGDDASDYTNVHTLINSEDMFPALPLAGGWNGVQYDYDSSDKRYQAQLDWLYDTPNWTPPGVIEPHNPPTYLAMMLTDLPTVR